MTQDVKAQHTPGPWVVKTGESVVHVLADSGAPVCVTTSGKYWQRYSEQSLADARLIASAPELLEALTDMVREASMLLQNAEGCAANHYGNDIEMHGEPQWITDSRARIVAARAAIAKATREQP